MLIDEAMVLSHLRHQSIAQVLELGSEGGVPFIAMEFIEGIDCARLLKMLIREKTPLPAQHALYIIGQVLLALEFAHRCVDPNGRPLGIVHRDVSPSNILLSWSGEVKVTDFGIAKGLHRTRLTSLGQLRGKYSYMAPEQARGEMLDARTDIFACGIVFFELLTARQLFSGENDLEVLERVKRASLPQDVMYTLSDKLQTVLLCALGPERESRYGTAAEMLGDIRSLAGTMEGMSTSLELAAYLHDHFENDAERGRKKLPVPVADVARVTEVFYPKIRSVRRKGRTHGSAPTWIHVGRVVGMLFILFVMLSISSARGEKNVSIGTGKTISSKMMTAVREHIPPNVGGVIAIDSEPSGASGILVIGEQKQKIRTPFTMDGITIANGLDGHVELGFPGYRGVSRDFRLTVESSTFVRNFALTRVIPSRLSVQARPWGLVDVPGYLLKRETPVRGLNVEPGEYVIKVRHPPSGRTVKRTVSIADGESMRCFATFENRASMKCH